MEAAAWSCLVLLVLARFFPSISPRDSFSELCYGVTLTVISIAVSVTNEDLLLCILLVKWSW